MDDKIYKEIRKTLKSVLKKLKKARRVLMYDERRKNKVSQES